MHPIISAGNCTRGRRPPAADSTIDAAAAAAQVRELRPDVVFVTSPNNPTGQPSSWRGHDQRDSTGHTEGVVVVDEAYEFARGRQTPSALTCCPAARGWWSAGP